MAILDAILDIKIFKKSHTLMVAKMLIIGNLPEENDRNTFNFDKWATTGSLSKKNMTFGDN